MNDKIYPLVSIVAPSHNQAPYVGACLDSVMFQDYPNIELIIVDDCSTDESEAVILGFLRDMAEEETSYAARYDERSGEIMRRFHHRYSQTGRTVTFMKNERNMGSTATYNRGLRAAKGEFCTFMATDDIMHPQCVSHLVRALEENQADFAYADMLVIDDNQRILREFKLPDYSFKACFEDWYLCGVATLYRRDLHERFGWYDENAEADDHECYLRFARNEAKFVHVPLALYSVRTHAGRQVGLHGRERFNALLRHSCRLTEEAREYARSRTKECLCAE